MTWIANTAASLTSLGRMTDAENLTQLDLSLRNKKYGDDDGSVAISLTNLANL